MVQYVAMVHPTALRGMCVTVPREMAGNKAVRGMNGLSQLPAMLCRKNRLHRVKRRGSVTLRTAVGYQHGVETPQLSLR